MGAMGPVEARFVDAVVLADVVVDDECEAVAPDEHAAITTALTSTPNAARARCSGRARRRPASCRVISRSPPPPRP
jgi:hypothetical protein